MEHVNWQYIREIQGLMVSVNITNTICLRENNEL